MRYVAQVALPFSLFLFLFLFISMLVGCGHGGSSSNDPSPPAPEPPAHSAPVAAFTSADSAPTDTPVVFDASASTAGDGGALQYVWDFGGGHRGGGKVIARLFSTAGVYSIKLTVIDSTGVSTSQTRTLEVSAPAVTPTPISAQGVVRTPDGTALQGVLVALVGASNNATTDALGSATLTVNAGAPSTLKLSKAGYADQFVRVEVPATAGSDAYFEATMRTRDAAQTLPDAAAGGKLVARDGATIVLPANGLVNSSGVAVSGPVSLAMTPVDPTGPGGGGFPGQFEGIEPDGSITPIVSYGTTEFTVTVDGQPLQLAPGKTATIEIPLYAIQNLDGSLLTAGSTVPLWSLDEASGIWVQEGEGTVVVSTSSPSGFALRAIVAHLSWWNADMGFDAYGPEPKCVYDGDIGIPEARDHFATATICNMLAEIDRNLGGNARAFSSPSARSSGARVAAAPSAALLSPQVVGFSRRTVVPIAGGVPVAVPANVDIVLTASALNGTWHGRKVVNGSVGVRANEEIKMRPLTSSGSAAEAVTLPFDDTRALQADNPTVKFNFAGTTGKYARIGIAHGIGSDLTGGVRLLQGSTVLGTAAFGGSPGSIVVPLPANATYTVEVTGLTNVPGSYHLQIEMLGGQRSESLTLPFDDTKAMAAYETYRGSFTVNAPTTVNFNYVQVNPYAASLRVVGPDGQPLLADTMAQGVLGSRTISLPVAGTYSIEIAPEQGRAASYRLAVEQTSWIAVAPAITPVSPSMVMIGLLADRNGKPVVGYSRNYLTPTPVNHRSVAYQLKRWTGTAWENIGTELLDDMSCNDGTRSASLVFDSANNPFIVHSVRTAQGASSVLVSKLVGGAWQPVGPNGGALPNAGASTRTCDDIPVIRLDSSDNPVVAYRAEGNIHVQKFDGTSWVDVVGAGAATFASWTANFDLNIDGSDRVWFVLSEPTSQGQTVVRRLASLAASAWDRVGANNGILPETNTGGISQPKLLFNNAGSPLIGAIASVVFGNGTSNTGTIVYRYNGSVWSSTGGYHPPGNNSHISNPQYGSFAVFENEGVMAWLESNMDIGNMPVVQTSTASGWSPIGANIGRVPQFTPHGTVEAQGWQMSLSPIGNDLFMAITWQKEAGSVNPTFSITLLRKTD